MRGLKVLLQESPLTKTLFYWAWYAYVSICGLFTSCSVVTWNTAVNVSAWLAIVVCNKARGRQVVRRREG